MLTYAARRLGLGIAIVRVAMAILFSMIYLIPGDPAAVALGPKATPAVTSALRLPLGRPSAVRRRFR